MVSATSLTDKITEGTTDDFSLGAGTNNFYQSEDYYPVVLVAPNYLNN